MPANLGALKILLLEDHFFMRNIWRTMLTGLGIREIVDAATAQEALHLLESEKFDIVIADYHLSGPTNGAEFIRQVRALDNDTVRLLPIIGCTADTRRAIVIDFVNAGVDELVAKPVSAAAAWSRLQAVIERRRPFVRTQAFFGPDRRRKIIAFKGEERRDQD